MSRLHGLAFVQLCQCVCACLCVCPGVFVCVCVKVCEGEKTRLHVKQDCMCVNVVCSHLHSESPRGLHDGHPFMRLAFFAMRGVTPKSFSEFQTPRIDMSGAHAEITYDTALQLALFQLVKHIMVGTIALKAGFHEIVPWIWQELPARPQTCDAALFNNSWDPPLDVRAALRDCVNWFHVTRKRYLHQQFQLMSICLTDVRLHAYLNQEAWAQIEIDRMGSSFLPFHFSFTGIRLAFLSQPLLRVESLNMSRVGLPSRSVADVTWTERDVQLADFRDLELQVRKVHVQVPAQLNLGLAVQNASLMCDALVSSFRGLPSLNFLSKRTGGPGYDGFFFKPDPGVHLAVDWMHIELLDKPLDAFVTRMQQVWKEERVNHLLREETLRLKIKCATNVQIDPLAALPIPSSSSSAVPSSPPAAAAAASVAANAASVSVLDRAIGAWIQALQQIESSLYVDRVKKLKSHERLTVGPLLDVHIRRLQVDVSFQGSYGSFRRPDRVFAAMRSLDEATGKCSQLDALMQLENFPSLAGQYVTTNLEGLDVRIRNYPLKLAAIQSIHMTGAMVMANHETSHEFASYEHVPLSSGYAHSRPLHVAWVRRSFVPTKFFYDFKGNGRVLGGLKWVFSSVFCAICSHG
jgi:hypothetical protein